MVLPKNILIGVDFNAKVPAVDRVFVPKGMQGIPFTCGSFLETQCNTALLNKYKIRAGKDTLPQK